MNALVAALLVLSIICSGCAESEKPAADTVESMSPTGEELSQTLIAKEFGGYIDVANSPFDEVAITNEFEIVAKACALVYRSSESSSGTSSPDRLHHEVAVEIIGNLGYPSITYGTHMQNPEAVFVFYDAYKSGDNADLGIYLADYNLMRLSFHTENGEIFYTGQEIVWNADGSPSISPITYVTKAGVFTITDKGYLFYGNDEEPTMHYAYLSGFRIKPLDDEKRAMTKYLEPLETYAGHNILTGNWDRNSIERINFNDVFEMLYRYEYGNSPDEDYREQYYGDIAYIRAIPGDVFERVICKYFPVTATELRVMAVYDPERQVYAIEPAVAIGYSPDWEVVDYFYNPDGSLTLTVDAVSAIHGTDRTATNIVIVMPGENGDFQYVGNQLEYVEERKGRVPSFPTYAPRIEK